MVGQARGPSYVGDWGGSIKGAQKLVTSMDNIETPISKTKGRWREREGFLSCCSCLIPNFRKNTGFFAMMCELAVGFSQVSSLGGEGFLLLLLF